MEVGSDAPDIGRGRVVDAPDFSPGYVGFARRGNPGLQSGGLSTKCMEL